MLEGLRTDEEKVQQVITLFAYGCPLQTIVRAFGFDECTVAAWQRRAGVHCKQVHMDIVQQGRVKSQHITRKCRHAAVRLETLEAGMYLIECTYNFCFPHQELSKKAHVGCPTTPAMAAALTDHIWSMRELLWYKAAPAPWVQAIPAKPKRPCGRPRKPAKFEEAQPKRPRGRPPKYVLAEVLAEARRAGAFTS